jgi:phage-related protein
MRANPIGLVITAVLLLVGAVVLAYKKSETFRRIVDAVMRAVKGYIMGVIKVLGTVVSWVREKLPAAWTIMKSKAVAVWNAIKAVVAAVAGRIVDVVMGAKDRVVAGWQIIRERAGAAWDWVRDKVATIIGNIRDKVATIRDAVQNAADAIRDKLGGAWDWVMDKIQPIINAVQDIIDLADKIHIPGMRSVVPGVFGRTAAAPAALVAGSGDRVTIELPLLSRIDDRSVGQLVGALDDYYRRRGKVVRVVPA